MEEKKRPGRNLKTSAGILFLAGILIIFWASCESIFGPKTEESTDTTTDEARIVVTNNYGESLDIYMDGNFQFTLGNGNSKKIHNVSLDEHNMEGRMPSTGTVVDKETIDVSAYQDYTYTISPPPSIDVINKYGVTLKIYMDDNYKFDLMDEEDRWIMHVSKTTHYLKALKASDNKEVASTTIDIDQDKNKDYTWTIS
jgi:hypothetical protein